jgi:hypothetical protein
MGKKLIDFMESWIQEIIPYSEDSNLYVQVEDHEGIGDPSDPKNDFERIIINIYTDTHCYNIVLIDRENDPGYIGCQSSIRKPYVGEDHTRGRDLSDGKFTRETWNKIKDDIIKSEILPLYTSKHEGAELPLVNNECDYCEGGTCCADSVPISEYAACTLDDPKGTKS